MRVVVPSRGRLRARRLVALGVVAVVGVVAAYLGLRDTSLFAVRTVTVRVPADPAAPRMRAALVPVARRMTTLHIRHDELREAVAGFPQVKRLDVDAHLPHRLTITVREHVPVALLVAGARSLPVARDGVLLPGVAVAPGLPTISVDLLPSGRLARGRPAELVRVLAAAPPPLRERVASVGVDGRGIVARLRAGPELVFGATDRLAAKWAAGARVLADPVASGAGYLDLTLPERTAVGPVSPGGASAATTTATTTGGSAGAPTTSTTGSSTAAGATTGGSTAGSSSGSMPGSSSGATAGASSGATDASSSGPAPGSSPRSPYSNPQPQR